MRNPTREATSRDLAGRLILGLGVALGLLCFGYYYRHGLTVAHYDAKAHLVVARRIVDAVAPGYAQMGANWLPLLHLIYLPFVLFDAQYRTGLLPSLVSVASYALSGWLVYRIAFRGTGSIGAGVFAGALLLANPNLEYLQSCPLTEPVYMVLELLSLDSLLRWREKQGAGLPWVSAAWASLAGLCRYEGWYFLAGVVLLLAWDFRADPGKRPRIVRAALVYIGVFGLPVAAHFAAIYVSLGDSFLQRIAHGSQAPYETYKRPLLSLMYHGGELCQALGAIPLLAGLAGVVFFLTRVGQRGKSAPLLLLWLPSLINVSALYWGMIYRVRYSVLLAPAAAVFAGVLAGSQRWAKATMIIACLTVMALPWLSWSLPHEWAYRGFYPGPGVLVLPAVALILLLVSTARGSQRWSLLVLCVLEPHLPVLAGENQPIIAETFEHGFIEPERHEVLEYLRYNYDGSRILIDMGKLAPLVYDSRLPVKEFVYSEGDDSQWRKALQAPEDEVGWLIAQKGDEVWGKLRTDPEWTSKYSLALHTDYFSVYRLKP